jgi:hypothetical protein
VTGTENEITVIIECPDIGTVIVGDNAITAVIESESPGTIIVGDNPITVCMAQPEFIIISEGVPGPAGADTASEVSYDNATYANVQAALDGLLYVAPIIKSFSNNVGTVEIGSTVSSLTLAWSLNKAMTSLSINGGVGSVLGLTSKSLTGLSLTDDITYSLTAADGQNTTSAETTIAFRNKRYWGVSASESLDNAGVLGLSGSEFATDFEKSITYDATGGRYLYYAFPETFGTPSHVTVGGLAFSDFTVSILSFTNASGHTEAYNVIRRDLRFQVGIVGGVQGCG